MQSLFLILQNSVRILYRITQQGWFHSPNSCHGTRLEFYNSISWRRGGSSSAQCSWLRIPSCALYCPNSPAGHSESLKNAETSSFTAPAECWPTAGTQYTLKEQRGKDLVPASRHCCYTATGWDYLHQENKSSTACQVNTKPSLPRPHPYFHECQTKHLTKAFKGEHGRSVMMLTSTRAQLCMIMQLGSPLSLKPSRMKWEQLQRT